MGKIRFIEELCVSLQSNLAYSAIFARHIAHILPNYHTERIKEQTTNHREVAPSAQTSP
jgi:hypothetical protein